MTYIPGINQPIPSSPSYPSVTAGDLTPSEYPMVYTTDGPLPTANGIAFTTTGLVFDPQQVTSGLVTKIIAGNNITIDPVDGSGIVTISATDAVGVASITVTGNNLSVDQSTGDVTLNSTVIPQRYGTSSMSIGFGSGSPGSPNGGNTFVGADAGANAGGAGGTNTFVGYKSGENTVGGTNNVFVGAQTLTNITSGANNTLVGANAGASIGSTTSFTTIVGSHQGYAGTQGEVIIGRNSNFLRLNSTGALCIATNVASADFGTTGEVLTSQGDGAPPVWTTLATASTTTPGLVQLNDTTISTSTSQALTANAGKQLQDQINALTASSNLTFAGTIDGATGFMVTVTTEGASVGFTVGSAMPAPAAGNAEYFTIVTVAGNMTPPGGSATDVHPGDWWLSTGSAYQLIDSGVGQPYASTTDAGIVELATNAETQTGTSTTLVVTPSGLQSKVSDSVSTASSTGIASSQAVKSAYDAATAAQGDATTALGDAAKAEATANAAIPCAAITAKGVIIAGSAASTPTALPVGSDGQILVADSSSATGLNWTSEISPTSITDCAGVTGTAGQVLSSTGTALEWVDAGGGGGGSQATPQALGTVYGYTADSTDTTSLQRTSTILGWSSIPFPNAINSVAIGYNVLSAGSCANNSVVIGNGIGVVGCLSGSNMVIIGEGAARSPGPFPSGSVVVGEGAGECVGENNTYLGKGAGSRTQGCRNTAIGCGSMLGNGTTTSFLNTALGSSALNTTGCCNTALGAGSGNTGTSITGNNNTFVGYGANALGPQCSNHITLGNSSITTIRAAVTSITALSDARDKTNVTALPVGLDFINALNPVKFTWQMREPNPVKDGTDEAGFIAQELQAVQEQFGVTDLLSLVEGTEERLEASPGKLIPVLVKAIQELSARVEALEGK